MAEAGTEPVTAAPAGTDAACWTSARRPERPAAHDGRVRGGPAGEHADGRERRDREAAQRSDPVGEQPGPAGHPLAQ